MFKKLFTLFSFALLFFALAYFFIDLEKHTIFVKKFIASPKTVGAIAPSSRFLTDEITSCLMQRKNEPIRVLEVGAGTGEFTEKIISLLRPEDHLDIIEIEEEFCKKLELLITSTQSTKYAHVHCQSILDWKPDKPYDYIISGLPFNSFDGKFVEQVIEHYLLLTKVGSTISYFEYPLVRAAKETYLSLADEEEKLSDFNYIKKVLLNLRNKCSLQKNEILINVPPARVYHLLITPKETSPSSDAAHKAAS